jgi:hypothetical protein
MKPSNRTDNQLLSEAYEQSAIHSEAPGEGRFQEDDRPSRADVTDFDNEIMDLYWTVVDSGVDENLANNWVNDLRKSLARLLETNNSPDLQDLGSKF